MSTSSKAPVRRKHTARQCRRHEARSLGTEGCCSHRRSSPPNRHTARLTYTCTKNIWLALFCFAFLDFALLCFALLSSLQLASTCIKHMYQAHVSHNTHSSRAPPIAAAVCWAVRRLGAQHGSGWALECACVALHWLQRGALSTGHLHVPCKAQVVVGTWVSTWASRYGDRRAQRDKHKGRGSLLGVISKQISSTSHHLLLAVPH